jgi:hypothetical protein
MSEGGPPNLPDPHGAAGFPLAGNHDRHSGWTAAGSTHGRTPVPPHRLPAGVVRATSGPRTGLTIARPAVTPGRALPKRLYQGAAPKLSGSATAASGHTQKPHRRKAALLSGILPPLPCLLCQGGGCFRSKYRAARREIHGTTRRGSHQYKETAMKWLWLQSLANASPDCPVIRISARMAEKTSNFITHRTANIGIIRWINVR